MIIVTVATEGVFEITGSRVCARHEMPDMQVVVQKVQFAKNNRVERYNSL